MKKMKIQYIRPGDHLVKNCDNCDIKSRCELSLYKDLEDFFNPNLCRKFEPKDIYEDFEIWDSDKIEKIIEILEETT